METNPYESPSTESGSVGRRVEWSLLMLVPSGIAGGVLIGALTNACNGLVCPEYFQRVMRWPAGAPLWWWSVRQGMFEGAVCGFLFALVLTVVMAVRSGMGCPYGVAVRYFLAACMGVLTLWGVGGVIGAAWGATGPASFQQAFPQAISPGTARFAWVGGSIWGAQFGGAGLVLLTSVVFCWRWRAVEDLASQQSRS